MVNDPNVEDESAYEPIGDGGMTDAEYAFHEVMSRSRRRRESERASARLGKDGLADPRALRVLN